VGQLLYLQLMVGGSSLVHLHDTVDLPHKPEAGEKSDTSCQKEETEHHDARVTEIQEGRRRPLDVQLGEEVVDAVHGQVERSKTTCQEAAPPPMVILSTQVEITEKDCGLGTSDD